MSTWPGASRSCCAPGSSTVRSAGQSTSRARSRWPSAPCAIEAFAPPPDLADLEIHLTRMGQRLFYPPNVAGWPGGLAWLRGSTVLARASFAAWLTDSSPGLGTDHFLSLAKRRCGGRPEAWLDTLVVLLCGAEISPQTKKEILAAAQSEDKPGRQYGRILSRLLTLPELQLG